MSPALAQASIIWAQVCAFMEIQCGVVLGPDQAYLLEPRLAPLAKRHGFASLGDFVAAACVAPSGHPLQRAMIDAMTTHESSFFRDPSFWLGLEKIILPARMTSGQSELRVWSAACSFGQEAYSMAMLLEELYPHLAPRLTIVATDISGEAIERGRLGIYGSLEVSRGCTTARLGRHFDPVEGGYQVKARLRERISWGTHNLLKPLPNEPRFDLIFCRNVLIYFTVEVRREVFTRLLAAAAPGGYVGLGNTEQAGRSPVAPGWYAHDEREKDDKKNTRKSGRP